jgi:ATP-dependent protease ClpP protease subunit
MADRKAPLAWKIQNRKSDEADVYVYDVIGDPWLGTPATEFVQELRGLDVSRINLHVNSPGGYVDDAIAMFNAIQAHPAEVVAYVEGSADSAASFLVQAADKRVIAKNSRMTIHDGEGLAYGTAAVMREAADRLEEESNNIASIYADRAGGTVAEWRDRMRVGAANMGTPYRGQEAVDAGLADEVGTMAATNWAERIAAWTKKEATELAVAAVDELDDLTVELLPPMAALAGYHPPVPALEALLAKHPLEVK